MKILSNKFLIEVIEKELKSLNVRYEVIQEQIISDKRELMELEHTRDKMKGKIISLNSALRGLDNIEE